MGARLLFFMMLAAAAARGQQTPATGVAIVDARFEDYQKLVLREPEYPAGDNLYLTFRISGFRPDVQNRVRLAYWIDCFDPEKLPLADTLAEKIEQVLAPQDEKWRPKVDWSLPIPRYAPSGAYRVVLRVRDEIAGREAQAELPFRVKGEAVEPSATLVVRDFEFAEEEEGRPKLSLEFTPGSTLWARFRVVGFRVGPQKQINVEEDLAVVDAEGKVLFSSPNAGVEKYSIPYPPRFLTAAFNLNLDKKVKPGEYLIRLEIRDLVGNQSTRFESKFHVRAAN